MRTALIIALLWCAMCVAHASPALQKCWLSGIPTEALCGVIHRPLDPERPAGVKIKVHFAVVPALARNKEPDPVFYFAGGPGQSAVELAGRLLPMFNRVLNRRDLVLMDQRGTGLSAPLKCPEANPGGERGSEPSDDVRRMDDCRTALQQLPHGDLRFYSTLHAAQDVDAIRRALGVDHLNLVASSYGTRVALEYMRQQGTVVRRVVLDGVSPADMALPQSLPIDNQAALNAMFLACEQEPACAQQHQALKQRLRSFAATLPQSMKLLDPVSGRATDIRLTRDRLMNMVRVSLYSPLTASALPAALEALLSERRLEPLAALTTVLGRQTGARQLSEGMHHSVVCSEDMARLGKMDKVLSLPDFDQALVTRYAAVCANWPKAVVPAGFYTLPTASGPVLLLSGGDDPATPPRHGARVAARLGPLARHVVVPHAAHGVLSLGCMTDVMFRFISEPDPVKALAADIQCVQGIPRPVVFDVRHRRAGGALD